MQPHQQLQWKKSQAQTRLLSRKRKLAELFSVTASDSLEDYSQKLQAFQDANNLERGRLFDAATLPPRRPFTRSLRKQQVSHTPNSLPSPTPVPQRQKTPVRADSLLSSKPSQKSRGPSPNRLTPKPITKDRHVSPSVNGDYGARVDGVILDADAEPAALPTQHEQSSAVHGNQTSPATLTPSPSQDPPTQQFPPDKPLRVPEIQETNSTPDEGSLKTGLEDRPRSRSPLVLAPAANPADPQSSPASTNGPGSSNTPGPVPGSPNTSPDEEVTSIPETLIPGKPSSGKDLDVPRMLDSQHSTQGPPVEDASVMELDSIEEIQAASRESDSQTRSPKHPSSRKPSMRIDTQTDTSTFFKPTPVSSMVESPSQMTAAGGTPRRGPPATPSGQDSSKRATRISSGVLQKKSVSEILGETPKTSSADSPMSNERDSLPADSQRLADRDRREKSKLSTVVFAKPQKTLPEGDTIEVARPEGSDGKAATTVERDYLYTLFENKAYSMTRQGPMSSLIQNAHKTLSTADHLVDYNMQTECRILKRLYQLQEKGRWALRQPKRAEEAPRLTSHWDFLLDHMKWMRTDFREERKWKLAAAREMAEACAGWYASSVEERKLLQAKVRAPKRRDAVDQSEDAVMEDGPGPLLSSHPTPDLIPSHEDDSATDDVADPRDLPATIAPAAIFSLGASDFNFNTDKTPALDKLLNELPLYEPAMIEPDMANSSLAEKVDARWKTDVVAVSRYATEKLKVKEYKPPVKRSRYDYEPESSPTRKTEPLPPAEKNVALFMPENKHIRDRIHPGHSFRPPSEHPMPTQTFFETRSSSQWTQTEDDELRRLVKDFSYNWSLISSVLTPRSLYTSGADRRTPWECFERWIGLEGLPADMSKTPYFKTYSGRIEAAGRHVAAQIEEAQRRAGANVQIPARKRTTQPVRVDRKRNQRHLAMLDAMRKLAKKRETTLQKQQHQAELQAMRKVNEVNQPKAPFKHPAEYSTLRHERDAKRAEQQEIYRQQLIAHQRVAAQAQRSQTQTNGLPNGLPTSAGGMRAPPGAMPGMPNGGLQVPNGQGRPHPAVLGMMNGGPMPQAAMMGPKALAQAQAQMQANLARGINTSPQQMRILQEAQKVQQEQLMRQQAQQNGQHSSPTGAHAALANGQGMGNATYMAAMAGVTGAASPNGNSSSPRAQNAGQALSSGHVPAITQIQAKIREAHPTMPEEEVLRNASQRLQQFQQQATAAAAGQSVKRPVAHNQAAVNAAMGAVNAAAHAQNNAAVGGQYGQGMMTNEQVQQHNLQLQLQRARQAVARNMPAPQMQPGMMGMAASPVMNMARPVSQQANQGAGQMSRSVTPRDQRSGSMGQGSGVGQQGSPQPGSSRAMQQT